MAPPDFIWQAMWPNYFALLLQTGKLYFRRHYDYTSPQDELGDYSKAIEHALRGEKSRLTTDQYSNKASLLRQCIEEQRQSTFISCFFQPEQGYGLTHNHAAIYGGDFHISVEYSASHIQLKCQHHLDSMIGASLRAEPVRYLDVGMSAIQALIRDGNLDTGSHLHDTFRRLDPFFLKPNAHNDQREYRLAINLLPLCLVTDPATSKQVFDPSQLATSYFIHIGRQAIRTVAMGTDRFKNGGELILAALLDNYKVKHTRDSRSDDVLTYISLN
ncbi:MAG: hypothetical protein LBJ08_08345 [Bifidobacteriaceae bacterium]|jgi:hypothetical protein|nr:hypothetical protein [Bifidobacteriaceae bacterium]